MPRVCGIDGGRGARLYRRTGTEVGREADRQGQVDDDRGDRAQSGSGSGRDGSDRDRSRGIYRATAARTPFTHHHARHPPLQGGHRAPLSREARDDLHGGAGATYRRGEGAASRGVPWGGHWNHRGEFRGRGDGDFGGGGERGERADVLDDAGYLRGGDGNREGDSAAL